MSQTKVKSGLIDFTEGIDSFIEFSGGNSTVTGNLTVTGTLVGYTPTASLNISNWDTAYSYSQVGHLPLTGGTLTGQLTTSDTGTSSSIVITSDSIGNGAIDLIKNTNGTGIRITNNGVGSGIVAFNNSTGTGITIANTSTGKGLLIDNSSSTTGDPFVYTLGGAAYVKAKINYVGNLTLAGTITASGYNNSNWDTAYGWGNHASAGYLTSFDITTQTDAKYLRSDQSDTMTGYLTINGGLIVKDLSNNFTFGHDSTSTSILSGGVQQLYIEKGETFEIGPSDALDDVNYYGLLHRFYTKDAVGKSVKMVLNQNGNVGIGTTSPSEKLHVQGRIMAEGAGYTLNPIAPIFGQYTASRGYIQVPSSGQFEIWTGGTSEIATFRNNRETSFYGTVYVDNGVLNLGSDSVASYVNSIGDVLVFDVDSNVNTAGTPNMQFKVSGSTKAFLNSTGLGIGTTSPQTKLNVYGGHGDAKIRLYSLGDEAGNDASLDMWASEPGVSYDGSGIGNNVAGHPYYGRRNTALGQSYMRFGNGFIALSTGTGNASERMRITSSGLVGIGTSNPEASLDVVSNSGGNGIAIRTRPANDWGWLIYDSNDSSERLAEIGVNRVGVNSGDLYFTTSGSTKMVIKSGGYVGIGTTSPSYKLDVSGAVSASDYFTSDYYRDSRLEALMYYAGSNQIRVGSGVPTDYLLLYAGASPRMTILSNGYIGINNTNPYRTLQVDGHVGVRNGSFFLGDESGSTNDGFQFYKYSNILRIYKDTGSFGGTTDAQGLNLDLFSGSAYSTRISGNGDSYFGAGGLGVNTTSLSNTLHVNGSFRNGTSSIYFTSAADGGGMYIESVGTTTATRTLRLQGINDAGNAYTQFLISHGAGNIRTVINDQEKIKIDGDGLKFNGDTAAANALDDYEEGTFTPTLDNAGTPNYSRQYGKYTKIGNLVFVTIKIEASSITSSGNTVSFNLPFTAADAGDTSQRSSGLVEGDWVGMGSYVDTTRFRVAGAYIQAVRDDSGSSVYLAYNNLDSSIEFNTSITYLT